MKLLGRTEVGRRFSEGGSASVPTTSKPWPQRNFQPASVRTARRGFDVCAVDYSEPGLQDLLERAERAGLGRGVRTVVHDVRRPLPFETASSEACFSHMLYCMALTTAEIEALSDEIHRVLEPGGLNYYTARNLKEPDLGTGIKHGEDLYELEGGFIVHFFSREVVECLAKGYELLSVEEFEETELPKRLYLVGLRKGSG